MRTQTPFAAIACAARPSRHAAPARRHPLGVGSVIVSKLKPLVVAFGVLLASSPVLAGADDLTNEINAKALSAYHRGKAHFMAARYDGAIPEYRASLEHYETAVAADRDPKRQEFFRRQADLLKRWIALAYCASRMNSNDIGELRELLDLGPAAGPPGNYRGACIGHEEHVTYVRERLDRLIRSGSRP